MAVKTKSENYRDGLVESIKIVGQMMIDNAEDLAGHMDMMSGFDISIEFDPAARIIPELTVRRSYLPRGDEILRLRDIYRNGKSEEKKTCENCGWYVNEWGCNIDSVIAKTNPGGDCPNWCSRDTYPEKECEIRGE